MLFDKIIQIKVPLGPFRLSLVPCGPSFGSILDPVSLLAPLSERLCDAMKPTTAASNTSAPSGVALATVRPSIVRRPSVHRPSSHVSAAAPPPPPSFLLLAPLHGGLGQAATSSVSRGLSCRSVMVHIDHNQVDQSDIDQKKQVDQVGKIDQVNEMDGDSADQPQEKLKDGQLDGGEGDITMVNEEENSSDNATVMNEEEEEEKISTPSIPSKSRSLRTTSVRKRLEIEVKMAQPKTKGRLSKKARLSKYRRKSANAKERERMKKQNDVFEVIISSQIC